MEREDIFNAIDDIAYFNQRKVLKSFQKNKLTTSDFVSTNGYGYGDQGREKLNKIMCDIFNCESCIASPYFMSGTHALSTAIFSLLGFGGEILFISNKPYDTLDKIINGEYFKNDNKNKYKIINLINDEFDKINIKNYINEKKPKLIFIQRSRGYEFRNPITIDQIHGICKFIHSLGDYIICVDNCYGEFSEKKEPTEVGADIVIGSFIKNIGGTLAPTGAYICGLKKIINKIIDRFIIPGIGDEIGSYAFGYQNFFQGLFIAPHIVAQAMKGVVLLVNKFSQKYDTIPKIGEIPKDIICSIKFKNKDKMIKLIQLVQKVSPVDSQFNPIEWDMPGYKDKIIMAAGTFVSGASLELSADAPIREPYIAYIQGGITIEHIKYLIENVEF